MTKEINKAELKQQLIDIISNLDPEDIIKVEGTHQPTPDDLPFYAAWDWQPAWRKLSITFNIKKTNGKD